MSTAQKVLKLPKHERDQYIAVVEDLYARYKDNYGSKLLITAHPSEGFVYHDIAFLRPDVTGPIIDFLAAEQVLRRDTSRIGDDYETSEEVPTVVIFLDVFNALVSGLRLDTVPKHIQDLPTITFDVGERVLT